MKKKSYENLRGPVAGLLLVLSFVAGASNTSVPEGKTGIRPVALPIVLYCYLQQIRPAVRRSVGVAA